MLLSQSVSNIAKRGRLRLIHTLDGSCAKTSHTLTGENPLFCYTSGRWLWNEREQLEARYMRFNIPTMLPHKKNPPFNAKSCMVPGI